MSYILYNNYYTSIDLLIIKRFKDKLSEEQKLRADITSDNKVDINDISKIRNKILSGNLYHIKNNTFRITLIYNDIMSFLDDSDKIIIKKACDRWASIISSQTRPSSQYDMKINIIVKAQDPSILASATYTDLVIYNNNKVPCEGSIWINSSNWKDQVSFKKNDGNSQAYYTILHEIGHIFGIGSYWSKFILNKKEDSGKTSSYYIGQNALREYRKLLKNELLLGIPIEDSIISGTGGGHPEEGIEPEGNYGSTNNRYIDGHLHSGLDRELMTGWAENDHDIEPLSSITIGFLDDIGYIVDYSKADDFILNSSAYGNFGEILYVDFDGIILNTSVKEYEKGSFTFNVPSNFLSNNVFLRTSHGEMWINFVLLKFENDSMFYIYKHFEKPLVINDKGSNINILSYYKGNKIKALKLYLRS